MTKIKRGLSSKFFRVRLFERNRSRFVWEFGTFFEFMKFYNVVKDKKVKRDGATLSFYLCFTSGDEIELDSFSIDLNDEILKNYDHPRREVKRLEQ